jgi:DNA (cytosine-5)-methyltransferase 3A
MAKPHIDVISGILGEMYPHLITQTEMFRPGRLEPICINAALVSAQNRNRLYWTNIRGIIQPKDKGIMLKDIIETGITEKNKSYAIDAGYSKGITPEYYQRKKRRQLIKTIKINKFKYDIDNRVYDVGGKSPCQRSQGQVSKIIVHNLQPRTGKGPGGKGPLQKEGIKSYCVDTANSQAIEGPEISWRKLSVKEVERLFTLPDNYTEGVSNTQRYKMLGNGWVIDVISHIFSFIPKESL